MSDRYLGIDAGGSRTVCVAGDLTRVLGRGTAGPANPSIVGVEGFRAAIGAAAQGALAGLPAQPVAVAWLGVAGSERPLLRDRLRAVAAETLGARRVEISHDARLLLAAADLEHGIGLVAGTGSSAYARAEDGREVRAGGWGHLLGDEGSGYDIAVRALRAVTAAVEGRGPETRLVELLFQRLGIADPGELRERCYPAPPISEVADLARTVLEAADSDPVAAAIVDGAADQLAALVDACAARLFGNGADGGVPVVLAGGLLAPGSALRRRLLQRLEAAPAGYRTVTPTQEPARGGLALARAGAREPPARPSPISQAPATHQ